MKRIIKVVLILLCVILVTGCEKKSDKENNLEQELRFKSHPEEKYNWYWKYEKGADEEVVTFVDSSFEEFEKPQVERFRKLYLSPKWSALLRGYLESAMEYRLYVRKAVQDKEMPEMLEYLPVVESNYKKDVIENE